MTTKLQGMKLGYRSAERLSNLMAAGYGQSLTKGEARSFILRSKPHRRAGPMLANPLISIVDDDEFVCKSVRPSRSGGISSGYL